MVDLSNLPDFKSIMLQDCAVLGWQLNNGDLVIILELSLQEGHQKHEKPREGEWACYKKGRLTFTGTSNFSGFRSMDESNPVDDTPGKVDYGTIDSLVLDNNFYKLSFEKENFVFMCQSVSLDVDDQY